MIYDAHVLVAPDYEALCVPVAAEIAALVRAKPNAALGLATGATPVGVYSRLVQMHVRSALDFSRVTCFNLDEYYPMDPDNAQSYNSYMRHHLFDHINCQQWFVPDGREQSSTQIERACAEFEARIRDAGGIDLQLLGIGRDGHVGFDEPGSAPTSRTRLVRLKEDTREDASKSFGGLADTPQFAISMGIATILEARRIILMASGDAKAEIVEAAYTGQPSAQLPATWLRTHPNVTFCLDSAAAARLPVQS